MLDYILTGLSVTTILISITLRSPRKKIDNYVGFLFTLIFCFYIAFFLVADYFTGKGIDESVFYHLRYGLMGAGFAAYINLMLLSTIGILTYLFVSGFLIFSKTISRNRPGNYGIRNTASRFLLLFAFILCPTTYSLLAYADLGSSFRNSEQIHSIEEYLIPPIPISHLDEKNIVYIYAESLERTFFDQNVFPGLIEHLREIENESINFTNIQQIDGTNWTIAGITASQCGIPLITPSAGNSMSGMDTFLPRATCLGELLSGEGYRLVYLSGGSVEFAGTGKFFATHAFDEILGADALDAYVPEGSDRTDWGLYDDTLLEISFEKFSRLSAQPQPFGLFLSTMDTHPNGIPSPSCDGKVYRDGENPMLNAVHCADSLISDFIKKIVESPYAKDTVIILSSDHLAMSNTASELLAEMERRNLLFIIDPNSAPQVINRTGSLMDVAPTLLHLLGHDAPFALGRSLLGGEEPLVTRLAPLDDAISSWKDSLISFWDFPKINGGDLIEVDPETRSVRMHDRVFKFPVLIEFDEQGKTLLRFKFYSDDVSLMRHVLRLDDATPFLWVDECMVMATMTFRLWDDYCVVFGEAGTTNLSYENLIETITLSPTEILDGPTDRGIRGSLAELLDRDRFIAHAGGGIDGNKYTNSLEALDSSYRAGFRLFELDIISTSDGHYVAAHDWNSWRRMTGFDGPLPPVRSAFLDHKIMDRYTALDMDRINAWFGTHPDAILVTDKVKTPGDFSERFLDRDRLIMEIFSMAEFEEAVRAGIKSPMPSWSMLSQFDEPILRSLLKNGVTEIAASRKILKNNMPLVHALKRNGIKIYLFGLNDTHDEFYVICNELLNVHGFYVDFLNLSDPLDCTN